MKNENTYCLLGCGGHARSVADVILENEPKAKIVFVDKGARLDEWILGFPVLPEVPEGEVSFVPAIGDNKKRAEWCKEKRLISVVSQNAHVGKDSVIGNGVFIANFVHVGPQVRIGDGTIVNTAAVIEHNVGIGKYCHIAPNSTICGGVQIDDNVVIGAGAIIKPMITVVANVVVGAGAVVVEDISKAGTYVGCPARKIN